MHAEFEKHDLVHPLVWTILENFANLAFKISEKENFIISL